MGLSTSVAGEFREPPFDRAEQCADATTEMHTMKDPMIPIDYFMALFTGMCIGVAGVAYVCS